MTRGGDNRTGNKELLTQLKQFSAAPKSPVAAVIDSKYSVATSGGGLGALGHIVN